MGLSHTTFSGLVSGIYGKLPNFCCSEHDMVWANILSIPNCFNTWSSRWFLKFCAIIRQDIPGAHVTGRYWLINVDTIVSADYQVLERLLANP